MVGDEWLHTQTVGPRQAPASSQAAIAQLGERQTEDLKVPSSILGLGTSVGRIDFGFVRTCGLSRHIAGVFFVCGGRHLWRCYSSLRRQLIRQALGTNEQQCPCCGR